MKPSTKVKSKRPPLKWKLIVLMTAVLFAVLILIAGLLVYFLVTKEENATYKGAVVTNGQDCAKIGRDILAKGGNAVDAAVAALFCEGLEMPQSMGLGGGFLMTIYFKSNRSAVFVDARETASLKASENMYHGNATLANYGILSVAVPGELRGYWEVYKMYGGKLPWSDLVQPSIDLCVNGIRVSKFFDGFLKAQKQRIVNDAGLTSLFINPATGDVYKEGDYYKNPKLAATLKIISEEGGDAMHNGSLTDPIVNEIAKLGGIITKEDMNNYRPKIRPPVSIKLPMNRTLYTTSLPGSGPLIAFMLNVLSIKGLGSGPWDIITLQRIVETFKYAYGKRTELGDPDTLDNLDELMEYLTSRENAQIIADKLLDHSTVQDPKYYGANISLPEDHGTAHLSILSPDGDAVSVTSTINAYFGSRIMLQDTGIILNDEMDDFSAPDIVNIFDVPPSPSNFIKPGKKPLSSMAPCVIVDGAGHVVLVVGAAGGTKIPTSIALTILRHLWFNTSLYDAVQEKRFHHQLIPMYITFETPFKTEDNQIVQALAAIGHKYEYANPDGFSAVTAISNISGNIAGAFDHRRQGVIGYI